MAYIGNTPESTLSINTKEYIATEGQTTFSAVYGESVRVYMNGLLLASSDYTATDGFTVVLNVGATAGDIIRIDGYADIATVSGVVTSVAGKTGNVTLDTGDVVGLDTTLNTKQDTLVSGDTIKTINGTSVLGNGDISTSDNTKLSLSGGVMTGAITNLIETSIPMLANDINLATGNLFTKTISGATTLTVSNIPTAGNVGYFILQLTNGGSATVTWFSGVKWAGGTAPTLTASGKDILSFYTIDGGATWNSISIQKDVK